MTTHYLKTLEPWFSRVQDGTKTAEIREHDRDFQTGDQLVLVKVRPQGSTRNARDLLDQDDPPDAVVVEVLHVAPGHMIEGLRNDFVMLSVALIGLYEHPERVTPQ